MNDVLSNIGYKNADWSWISERVIRVQDQDGPVALKQWQRSAEEREHFLHHLRYAERAGMQGIIPLKPVRGDTPMFESARHVYYFEPWIEEPTVTSSREKELKLLAVLAGNHKISEDEEEMQEEEWFAYKQEVQHTWHQEQLMMNRLADQCEQSRFLSPFELTFLQGYPFFENMFKDMRQGFQTWARQVQEKGVRRFAFCHGFPTLDHGLISADGNAYFTNWETSGPGHLAFDLACFYRDLSRRQPFHALDSKRLYETYEAYGPSWSEADTGLLKALMLTPRPILDFADTYAREPYRYAEHQWTAMLAAKVSHLRYLRQMIQWKEKQEAAMKGS
ncbi:phosphotransferase [Natribacillus halophilus]|nr:phosphotransferase [Natribacillus halophilus]